MQWLQADYERIDGLLAIMEESEQEKTHQGPPW